MSERLTHSKFALAATILPLAVWVYLAIVIGLFYVSGKFGGSFFSGYEGGWAIGLVFYFFVFIAIPVGAHLSGFLFGVLALFSKSQKRVFAVTGMILSILPFAVVSILYASGCKFGF